LKRVTLPSATLILLTSLYIALADNSLFWSALAQRLDLLSLDGFGFAVTFFALMSGILALLLLVLGQGVLLKPVLILFLITSSLLAYFNGIGVVVDDSMIRNMLETIADRNTNEAAELLSAPLLWHVLLFGVLPSALVAGAKVRQTRPLRELLSRTSYALGIVVVIAALVMVNFKYLTYFSRENRDLRVMLTPHFPITAVAKTVNKSFASDASVFHEIGDDALQAHAGRKRVGIMIVGETARGDHFSLNGYQRTTNPLLQEQQVVSFADAWSCGTSTAYSVPCMFSFLDRDDYSPDKAEQQSNVLDVLTKAGVKVVWRDNNSSCKGVCARIESENFHHDFDAASAFYNQGEYIDEILLDRLDALINTPRGDVLIVFHTMGSHGPAYYKRYPHSFARFQPACESNAPHECDNASVANAYDNTIVYTDYILSKIIAYLSKHADEYDAFMLYASDHGESLGENGVYLHGLPYMIAPDAQKKVSIIAWLSDGLKRSKALTDAAIGACRSRRVSHDNLVHSLLDLFDVKTGLYRQDHDLFAGRCNGDGYLAMGTFPSEEIAR
jgi:lipid A ethanolaminephosphotransferase